MQRSATEHRLLWRTVNSPNGSATWDDGSLTFTDLGADGTRVTVRGRQLFALPPAWSGIDLDLTPGGLLTSRPQQLHRVPDLQRCHA
ncbi:MAG: hypothetical protein ACYDDU_00570 [Dermatophilaceae bacterium]